MLIGPQSNQMVATEKQNPDRHLVANFLLAQGLNGAALRRLKATWPSLSRAEIVTGWRMAAKKRRRQAETPVR